MLIGLCAANNRGGWKGRPVVVLGQKEGVPMGLHPLVSMVARPVKHVRLVTALLKAIALMRSKAQVQPSPCYCPIPHHCSAMYCCTCP